MYFALAGLKFAFTLFDGLRPSLKYNAPSGLIIIDLLKKT